MKPLTDIELQELLGEALGIIDSLDDGYCPSCFAFSDGPHRINCRLDRLRRLYRENEDALDAEAEEMAQKYLAEEAGS